jgi:putative transposase
VKRMSAVLGMCRDAYYKRRRRQVRTADRTEAALELVRAVRTEEPRTGTRKLHHRIQPALRSQGLSIGRDQLFDALRGNRMLIRKKRRPQRTTYSNHQYAVAPNRLKAAVITAPNQAYVSDITYVALKAGFAYLFLVTDLYSRKIVGYHLSKDLSHYSALLALDKAIANVKDTTHIIHHSDRGSQYCCHEFLRFLGDRGMIPSMTAESHCYENAVAERVNGILKNEFDVDQIFESFSCAKNHVEQAIRIYNEKRTHWSLDLRTPSEVYASAK